jgi:hypothetical protein
MYHKAAVCYPQIFAIAQSSFLSYSQLRMKNSRKKLKSKSKAPAKAVKRSAKRTAKKSPQVIQFLVKKNGKLETEEEREKRLARREALTIRAFQMAYDNYHNQ